VAATVSALNLPQAETQKAAVTVREQTWAVLVVLRRPTSWQKEAQIVYGPLTTAEMDMLTQVIPPPNIHHIIAYPLRTVPTQLANLAAQLGNKR